MESSQSTKASETKFEIDRYKVSLYYNKYRYRVKFRLRGVHFFRYCSTVFDVNERLHQSVSHGYITGNRLSVLTHVSEFVDSVHAFVEWRGQETRGLISVTVDTVKFYTNSLEAIEHLQSTVLAEVLAHTDRVAYSEALPIDNHEAGAIYRRRPRSQWRMHFNWGKLTDTEIVELRNTLANYRVVLNPRLEWGLQSYSSPNNYPLYLRASDYIEYNDGDLTLILTLILGSHVRSVHPVLKLPDRTK